MFLLHKLKLRDVKESCVLTGPTIKNTKYHTFSIDGTQVSLRLPRHCTSMSAEPLNPKTEYSIKGKYLNNLISSGDNIGGLYLASRNLDFYGPVFGGDLATLILTLVVVAPREKVEGLSFFHPRAFEHFSGKLLEYQYGDLGIDGAPRWRAPVFWEPVLNFDSVAAKFQVVPSGNAG